MSDSIYHHHGDNNRTGFGAVPASIVHERGYENVRQQPTKSNDDIKSTFYAQSDPALQPSHKLVGVDVKASGTVEKLPGRMLKLKEIEILANKHCPPQHAKPIIILACMQVNLGHDDLLDENLAFLRNMDRAKSGSY